MLEKKKKEVIIKINAESDLIRIYKVSLLKKSNTGRRLKQIESILENCRFALSRLRIDIKKKALRSSAKK